jgi:hypothetical protein
MTWLLGETSTVHGLLVPPPVEFYDQSDAVAMDRLLDVSP